MLTYYIAYTLMLFAGIWRVFQKQNLTSLKSRRKICILFAVLWVCIIGLRHPSMGVDLQYGEELGYLGRFEAISGMTWAQVFTVKLLNYERGYMIFNKLLSYIGEDYQILLFVCALLSIGIVVWWIYRNSRYPLLSMLIYLGLPCFLINYSGLRQGLAIAITVIASEAVRKRKPIIFVLLVALAASFHSSAWIFLVAYPVYRITFTGYASVISTTLPLFVYVFRNPLFATLSRLFKDDAVPDNNGAITLFLVFWAIYLFAVLFEHKSDSDELGLRNLYLVSCLCQAFGGVYMTAIRVGYYFMIYAVLLLPSIICNEDRKRLHVLRQRNQALILYLPIALCFALFGLYSISCGSWSMSNPHSFFWQH